jgi:hypothetical protein
LDFFVKEGVFVKLDKMPKKEQEDAVQGEEVPKKEEASEEKVIYSKRDLWKFTKGDLSLKAMDNFGKTISDELRKEDMIREYLALQDG